MPAAVQRRYRKHLEITDDDSSGINSNHDYPGFGLPRIGGGTGLERSVKALLKTLLGPDDSLKGLFVYAILATAVAIVVLVIMARVASRIGGEAAIEREAEG